MAEQQLLLALQRLLKPKTSSAPKLAHLEVAVQLARDPQLVKGTACRLAGF